MKRVMLAVFCALALAFAMQSHAQTKTFDADWMFVRGDANGAEATSFDDAKWQKVDVPHDWSIEGPFDEKAPTRGSGGFLPAGVGWYRKHFKRPEMIAGARVYIDFDGVMANSE